MKILAVGDVHGDYKKIIEYLKSHKVDLVIITGDITQFGPAELGEEILNEIANFNVPVLAIPGNCDPESIHSKIENSKALNIHCRSMIINDIGICGFGGSNPTPFDTPLEFEEVQIYDEASKVLKGIADQKITLFITHAPPYDTKTDLLPSGEHAGSTSIRKIIEESQPSLCVCGHIHESMGVDEIGETKIINPGEISQGYGCLIKIDDSQEDRSLQAEIIKL
ncbi:MAG: metallophosphoesterase [Methanobacterium sp.]|nr:metallophosphoesterase [Methanobacterium sp.]